MRRVMSQFRKQWIGSWHRKMSQELRSWYEVDEETQISWFQTPETRQVTSVILSEDDVDGWTVLTNDEERVLWGGWTEMRLWKYGGWVVVRTSSVNARGYSMRSVILSQWRERRMRVMWQDLGALTTARAREFWICWRQVS